ncbi:class I SAM-dependent methyltransferase, partial [bacterium]|nr:class I SAM-dependent methyltransferase [bacterium]
IGQHTSGKKFDLIYCRHVIEHLVAPQRLVRECAELLTPEGVFVLQCPNGQSKEGLLFPHYWLKFLRLTRDSNEWGKTKTFLYSLSRRYGWGIDPPRHLWGITGNAIESLFASDDRYSVKIRTASLADPVFSPYWRPNGRRERIIGSVNKRVAGKLFQGMQLIAEIRRNK